MKLNAVGRFRHEKKSAQTKCGTGSVASSQPFFRTGSAGRRLVFIEKQLNRCLIGSILINLHIYAKKCINIHVKTFYIERHFYGKGYRYSC